MPEASSDCIKITAQVVKQEIGERNARVLALQDRWSRMRRLMDARAHAAVEAKVTAPGADTGLLCRTYKAVANEKVEEWELDAALLKELRAHEQQAAQELGQWQEKSQVTQLWDGSLSSLTPEQRDRILKDLAEAEFPGDPDAVAKALAAVEDLPIQ
jgi:isopentenyldiphosphate isomerase